jgi:hypothetical protein
LSFLPLAAVDIPRSETECGRSRAPVFRCLVQARSDHAGALDYQNTRAIKHHKFSNKKALMDQR